MKEQNGMPEFERISAGTQNPDAGGTDRQEDRLPQASDGQDAARSRRVEDAIYRRARGYKVAVRKTYKVKRVEYDPDTGRKTCEREELQAGTDEVVVPADVRACAYWLVNRAPARWREHPVPDPATDGESNGTVDFPPLKQADEYAGEDADVETESVELP